MSNTGYKYLSIVGDNRRVVFQPPATAKLPQNVYSFGDLTEAVEARNNLLGYDPDETTYEQVQRGDVSFKLPEGEMSTDDLWDFVTSYQERSAARDAAVEWHTVDVDGSKPIALAWLSDIHFGGPHVDYKAVKRDTQLIVDTDGFYAENHGDLTDNWIMGRLQAIQRQQIMQHKQELALAFSWLDKINPKLLWVVSGNHDLWIDQLSGLDHLGQYAKGLSKLRYLYDQYELRIKLRFQTTGAEWKIVIRHDWPGKSKYNPTHGIENSWRFGSNEFDIGVGGHTHIGTMARPFMARPNQMAWAILTGTYKRRDKYQERVGWARTSNHPTGASIFFPDGRHEFMYSVQSAAEYLTFLRS